VRYGLCLPLVFAWTDQSGTLIQQAGFTRDISTAGLYVSCSSPPPVESTVSLQIVLPANQGILRESLSLTATAQVVRSASTGEVSGFAAVGELAIPDEDIEREVQAADKPVGT
jgi:hypothetical protein